MAIIKTRNEIIEQALKVSGVIAEGENPTSAQISDSAIRLDWMVRRWQSSGVHLWTEREATLFLVKGQQSYTLGGSSTEHATTSFTETTLSADEASGQTVLSLTSTAGASVGDYIGVVQDDKTIHWSTISVLAPFEIADALTDDAASGNAVYFYTNKINKPLRIPDARRRESGIDIAMEKQGRIDYLNLPDKSTQGSPLQFYYKPNINDGELFIWNTASDASNQQIKFTFLDLINVFDTSASAADFPDEWIEALVYNLAVIMAPYFSQRLPNDVLFKAESLYKEALEWDEEDADITFVYGSR